MHPLYVDFDSAVNRTIQRKSYFLAKRFNYLAKIKYSKRRNMRDKKKHNLKVYGQSGYKYKETPTIILKGQWLKEVGFEIGNRVTLECDNGTIVIKVDENLSKGAVIPTSE